MATKDGEHLTEGGRSGGRQPCGGPGSTVARPSKGHALVVGGSGMLAGLCRRLAENGWLVSIVGRDRSKLAEAAAGSPRVTTISVDYELVAEFAAELLEAATERGPITLAVCWIRSWAPEALLAAAAAVAPGGHVVHVIGSQRSDASEAAIDELSRHDQVIYRQVTLGQMVEHGHSRWLTNDEISDGVYAAISGGQRTRLVGSVASTGRPDS